MGSHPERQARRTLPMRILELMNQAQEFFTIARWKYSSIIYSPCDDCCRKLEAIQMRHNIDMSVTFACLYNALCTECNEEEYISAKGSGCWHDRENFRRSNREALQELSSTVTVKIFKASESCEKSPWEQLRDYLAILDKNEHVGNSPKMDFVDWRQR